MNVEQERETFEKILADFAADLAAADMDPSAKIISALLMERQINAAANEVQAMIEEKKREIACWEAKEKGRDAALHDLKRFMADEDKRRAKARNGNQARAKRAPSQEEAQARAELKKALAYIRADAAVKAGKHGAIIAACRRYCRSHHPFAADGTEYKPESLARTYRARRRK